MFANSKEKIQKSNLNYTNEYFTYVKPKKTIKKSNFSILNSFTFIPCIFSGWMYLKNQ